MKMLSISAKIFRKTLTIVEIILTAVSIVRNSKQEI